MKIKDTIENNPVIWTLGILLAGYLAGIGTYRGVLEMADLQTVPKTARIVQPDERIMPEADYRSLTANRDSQAEQKLANSVELNNRYKLALTSLATIIDGKFQYEIMQLQHGQNLPDAITISIKQLNEQIRTAKIERLIDP